MRVVPDQIVFFCGPIIMIGFCSIGNGALQLMLRHIRASRSKMVAISPDYSCRRLAVREVVRIEKLALRHDNCHDARRIYDNCFLPIQEDAEHEVRHASIAPEHGLGQGPVHSKMSS